MFWQNVVEVSKTEKIDILKYMLSFLLPFIKDLNKLQQAEVEFETEENGRYKVAYIAISEYLGGPFFILLYILL